MKIINNHLIPLPVYGAMMLFGVVFARNRHKPLSASTINHKTIHCVQAKECGGYLLYYLRYPCSGFDTVIETIRLKLKHTTTNGTPAI